MQLLDLRDSNPQSSEPESDVLIIPPKSKMKVEILMSIVYHVIHSSFTEPNRSAIISTLYYKGTFLTVLLKPKFNYLLN